MNPPPAVVISQDQGKPGITGKLNFSEYESVDKIMHTGTSLYENNRMSMYVCVFVEGSS